MSAIALPTVVHTVIRAQWADKSVKVIRLHENGDWYADGDPNEQPENRPWDDDPEHEYDAIRGHAGAIYVEGEEGVISYTILSEPPAAAFERLLPSTDLLLVKSREDRARLLLLGSMVGLAEKRMEQALVAAGRPATNTLQ